MTGQGFTVAGHMVTAEEALRLAAAMANMDLNSRGAVVRGCAAWEYALRLSVNGAPAVEQRVKVWQAKSDGKGYRFARSVLVDAPGMTDRDTGDGQADLVIDALVESVRKTLDPIQSALDGGVPYNPAWLQDNPSYHLSPSADG
ncbi:hypothetical protein IMCGPPIG_01906 [Stenotrophomonas maltophilia]|uniref:hypothetical protein n=1 Tax=Stenotrophomonas sp. GD04064 TaxID=2975430 RepID=UPI0006219C23|nr:hypothetical protein [Stenotrophomonas sp. GD04064]KKF88311.1 hypothetical protein XY58_09805 [Stenotrophomonas maltophilia]MBA0255757.1 hypothetical protein [Stenotrophomonas maltophilia]MBA0452122.1 hypothetical protein [Stenotrophomonas maltophilia]MBA0480424.1 hypothetical protein [Stenotrophomonas maltophilia]MBA0489708.1 hypothetical protein [Stenotrophomonas maltophilia]